MAEQGLMGRIGSALSDLFGRAPATALMDPAPIVQGSPETPDAEPAIGVMISRPAEFLFLGGAYMKQLAVNDDAILRQEGEQSLRLFNALLDDDAAMSSFQQRRLAVVSRDWEVEPGDSDDPRSVKAADDFRAMLKGIGFDRVTNLLLYTVWYGYGVAEGIYTTKQHDGRLIIWLDQVVVPDRQWFGFTIEGELRYCAQLAAIAGEALPPNKFIAIRTGGTHDFAFYGLGLAHWVYWPVWFKRATMRFWALFLEKLAQPTIIGEYDESTGEKGKANMLAALSAITRESAVVVPKGLAETIEKIEAERSGSGASTYKDFVSANDEAIFRIVLGQPGTSKATPGGIGSTQADVHAEVRREIVKADSDLISEGISTFGKWLTRWNHGEDVAPPRVYRVLDDAEDLNTVAERDSKLHAMGIKRTDESIEEIYGPGYEREEPPAQPPLDRAGNVVPIAAARAAGNPREQFAAGDEMPLYVSRKLLNPAPLLAWAKAQGFTDLLPAGELHVTVLYSRQPVDPFALASDWEADPLTVQRGGPRKVEELGEKGVMALRFASNRLRWRHDDMIRAGGSHDYPEFLPHVTFAKSAAGVADLSAIEPYQGELRFGPEIFEPLDASTWQPAALEQLDFEAGELEAIDRVVAALCEDANPVFAAMADTLRTHLDGVTTVEGARVAILEAWERMPVDKLAKLTALPMLAERAAAVAGLEDRVTA